MEVDGPTAPASLDSRSAPIHAAAPALEIIQRRICPQWKQALSETAVYVVQC